MGYTNELCRRPGALPRFLRNRRGSGIVHPRSAPDLTTPVGNVLPGRNDQRKQRVRGGFLMREILSRETITMLNETFRKS